MSDAWKAGLFGGLLIVLLVALMVADWPAHGTPTEEMTQAEPTTFWTDKIDPDHRIPGGNELGRGDYPDMDFGVDGLGSDDYPDMDFGTSGLGRDDK